MDFTSLKFIFLVVPIFFLAYIVVDRRYKNILILAASLAFYAISDSYYLPVILAIILVNFYLGKQIENKRSQPEKANRLLFWGILFNVAALLFFKYLDSYHTASLPGFLPANVKGFLNKIALPLGLSYITFQNIAYLTDVNNDVCDSEKSILNFALYILLFPKILVGPIVLYRNIAEQIRSRDTDWRNLAPGLKRFILGLAKKVLIADTIARTINPGFHLASPEFNSATAWFMLVGYAIQIYFDFSGYTDMALGLGKMMGFTFVENFNYPYIAESITDFWRRWHISLSNWVREYIFIPLEFKRRKSHFLRQQSNFLIAFLITGLWHGLTANFVIWGLIHGLAMALEVTFLSRVLNKVWKPIRHIYTLAVVLLGWVFFRSDSMSFALKFLGRLAGTNTPIIPQPYWITAPLPFIDISVWLALGLGILFSLPIAPAIIQKWNSSVKNPTILLIGQIFSGLALIALFLLSIGAISSSGHIYGIYGEF
jgi:alginate O-acetyltransferase complex protein AlgI